MVIGFSIKPFYSYTFDMHTLHSILSLFKDKIMKKVLCVYSGTNLAAKEVEVERLHKVLDMRVWDHMILEFI